MLSLLLFELLERLELRLLRFLSVECFVVVLSQAALAEPLRLRPVLSQSVFAELPVPVPVPLALLPDEPLPIEPPDEPVPIEPLDEPVPDAPLPDWPLVPVPDCPLLLPLPLVPDCPLVVLPVPLVPVWPLPPELPVWPLVPPPVLPLPLPLPVPDPDCATAAALMHAAAINAINLLFMFVSLER